MCTRVRTLARRWRAWRGHVQHVGLCSGNWCWVRVDDRMICSRCGHGRRA